MKFFNSLYDYYLIKLLNIEDELFYLLFGY